MQHVHAQLRLQTDTARQYRPGMICTRFLYRVDAVYGIGPGPILYWADTGQIQF